MEKELEKNQKALEIATEVRNQIDEKIENSIRKSSELMSQIQEYEEEVYILKHRLKEYQKAINDVDNEDYKIHTMGVAYNLFQKVDFEKCPFYMKSLTGNSQICDYLQNQGKGEQLPQAIRAREKILQIEKKELMDSIKRVNSFIKQFERKVKQSNKWLTEKQKEQEKLYIERKEKYEKIEEENRRIQYSLELLAKDARNFEYLEGLSDQIAKKNDDIKEKKETLEGGGTA